MTSALLASDTKRITSLTWNLEGLKRNSYSLKTIVDESSPDFVFISEPNIFNSDVKSCMTLFSDEFCYELNAEDKHNEDIAMMKSKASGGTMVMWRRALDKYISVHPVATTSFLPIVFSPPDSVISIHIALYLPTAGREGEYMEQIALLNNCIEDLKITYKNPIIFIRGDGNTNPNNKERSNVLSYFMRSNGLSQVDISHKTYHHFLGGGSFDSSIDILLYPTNLNDKESITNIYCKNECPDMFSHHDAILSSVNIPSMQSSSPQSNLVVAPRLDYSRKKILWSEEGKMRYMELVSPKLSDIRTRWLDPTSKTSLTILLNRTNDILSTTAIETNKFIDLNKKKESKPKKIPREIVRSRQTLIRLHKNGDHENLKIARNIHRKLVRRTRSRDLILNNQQLHSIISSDPRKAFSKIRSAKSGSSIQVPHIMVGNKKYEDNRIIDGFFESLTNLKHLDTQKLSESPYNEDLMEDYTNIKFLCSHKSDLPPISLEKSSSILYKMKPTVCDFFSITTDHFINAGIAGLVHFNILINAFLVDVNNCTVEELNTAFALLLYKGHKKDRTLDSSYRTISTCPLLAKGLDMYIRELFINKWNKKQADTQYQGEGSSHELASLLITEAIQHSRFNSKLPIYLLILDAKSAFDSVVIPYLVRNLYSSGMDGHSVLYMENRLANRTTYCEFDKVLVGPIYDQQGLEQGGVSSSDCYKLYNNEILTLTNQSGLGVALDSSEDLKIAAVGQADDTALISNNLLKLHLLLYLVLEYCKKYNGQLTYSKTKLLQENHPFIPTTLSR